MNFQQFAEMHGLIIGHVIQGDRWIRVKTTDKPKHRNGSYKFLGDVGFVQNHATMHEVAVWQPDTPFTEEQKRAYALQRKQSFQKERVNQAKAIEDMQAHWARLPRLKSGHEYLNNKHLPMLGCSELRVDGDLLVIPVYRKGGYLVSLQTISPQGDKKYRYGCPIKGGFYQLKRPNATLTCLAEGFATGLAIYQSLPNANVIVCFDAGNMVAVAKELNIKGLTVVCADNDWLKASKTGINTGINRGTEAANTIGCGIAYPQGIIGTDWADALYEWNNQTIGRVKNGGVGRLRVEIMRGAKFIA